MTPFRFKEQGTFRLSPEDIEMIAENYEFITGSEDATSPGKFIMLSVTKAIQTAKPKIITDPAAIEENVNLKIQLEEAQNAANSNGRTCTELSLKIDEMQKVIEDYSTDNAILKNSLNPAGSIVLNFAEKEREFITAALEIYKRDKAAQTFEQMFFSIIANFQKAGYLKFDAKDIEYLKNLKAQPHE